MKSMDHVEAVQSLAVEQYLLDEFSAEKQKEFADHFLGCQECANDLRITSLFIETAKKVLATGQ
jgi:hypothetical protein